MQLLHITFAEAFQLTYGEDVDATPFQLTRNLNIQVFVKIKAKDVCFQRRYPLNLWLS